MKILYGVQGGGAGYIGRARTMAECLRQHPNLTVDWIFSGRPHDEYCDMQCFGSYRCFDGLTTVANNGCIQYAPTIVNLSQSKLFRDMKRIDVLRYDLVISDFEPISAWAAKYHRVPSLGISHQYAFQYGVPIVGSTPIINTVLRYLAPTDESLGLHWHHFNNPIFPPIVDSATVKMVPIQRNKVLVYLPHETSKRIISTLRQFPDYEFFMYGPSLNNVDTFNIHTRIASRAEFLHDLHSAERVICNSSFGLISEALSLGKSIMTTPICGNMEQLSNARALDQLGLALVTTRIDHDSLGRWLDFLPATRHVRYPDVAKAIVQWIAGGRQSSAEDLSSELWSRTHINNEPFLIDCLRVA